MVNVLFASTGRRVELVRAFQRAYQTLGLDGNTIAVDIDPLAPALQVADRFYIVPRLDDPAFIPSLVEICRREQVGRVFPLIDPDIPVLARHRAEIEATGARVLVVAEEMAEIAADKWQTYRFFRGLELPTPHSWLPDQIDIATADYPLFVKPRFGSAGKHTFKVHNKRELAFFLDYLPDPIVQEYLPGPEITNDVILDLGTEVLAVISRQRIEVRWGEVAKGTTICEPEITQACVRVAHALGATGPITVQCMMKDNMPHFTEINARLGGGVPLGIAAGADWPQWLLARAAGLSVEIPPLGSYQTGLYMTRFDDSFFLTGEDYARVASHRL